MCQVHTTAFVALLAPKKTYYTACHPGENTTTYVLHVVPITTHTHVRLQVYWRKCKESKDREEIKGVFRLTQYANEVGISSDFF